MSYLLVLSPSKSSPLHFLPLPPTLPLYTQHSHSHAHTPGTLAKLDYSQFSVLVIYFAATKASIVLLSVTAYSIQVLLA